MLLLLFGNHARTIVVPNVWERASRQMVLRVFTTSIVHAHVALRDVDMTIKEKTNVASVINELALLLTQRGHNWNEKEKDRYEKAVKAVDGKVAVQIQTT